MNRTNKYTCASVLLLIALLSGCTSNGNSLKPSGTLEATEVSISPLVSGRVLEVRKKEGDAVTKGDTLLVIDTELLSLQRKQLQAQFDELSATFDVLSAQQRQVRIQRENTEEKLSRQKLLLEKGSSSQQTIDDLTSQKNTLNAQEDAFSSQMTANKFQRARIDANDKMIARQLRDGIILAPANGTVLVRGTEPGESVTPQTIVYKLADLTSLTVKVYLAEPELGKVKVGQKVTLYADAQGKKPYEGIITFINPTAEFTPKNIQTKKSRADLVFGIKLTIDNPKGELHPGMPVEAEL